jgi:hypothetical protein
MAMRGLPGLRSRIVDRTEAVTAARKRQMNSSLRFQISNAAGGVRHGVRALALSAAALGAMWGQSFTTCGSNICATPTTGTNVGIGTTAPANTGQGLDIENASGRSTLRMGTGLAQGQQWEWQSTVIAGVGAMNLSNLTNGTNPFTVLSSGNVGIGNKEPVHALQVAGTIGAEEVIVSATGADYVFDPGYKPASLSEVSKYIDENHHLPDIPSAAEVQENGVGLSEMQGKLLAKIEELTLHMIQSDERNNRLEERNRELQGRVARLEAAAPVKGTP